MAVNAAVTRNGAKIMSEPKPATTDPAASPSEGQVLIEGLADVTAGRFRSLDEIADELRYGYTREDMDRAHGFLRGRTMPRNMDENEAMHRDLAIQFAEVRIAALPPTDPAAATRKIGNRFVIRNNQVIKLSSGEALPEWEPLFLMRARDNLALIILRTYRELAEKTGCTEYILKLFDETIADFEKFKREHGEWMKQPGVTQGKEFIPATHPPTDLVKELEGLRDAWRSQGKIITTLRVGAAMNMCADELDAILNRAKEHTNG